MLQNRDRKSCVPCRAVVASATQALAAFMSASMAVGAGAEQPESPAQASVGAGGGIGLGVGGSAVTPFSQAPLRNSVDWIGHCASRGGAVDEGVDFEQHPVGDLVGDFYLCSHGVAMSAQAMTWVRAGTGAETGAVTDIVSPGEGEMPPSRYLLNGEPGSWSLTITFRRPVSGAGIMTADLYNPSGLNGLSLRSYAGAAATGAMLAETTSPALCFQRNHRYFIGLSDDSARIRSIVLSCPNVHLDTVFLEYLAFSTPASTASLDGDINGDAAVDDADMGELLAAWGDPHCIAADLDENGLVDGADLGILLSQIATAPPSQDPAEVVEAQTAVAIEDEASGEGAASHGVTALGGTASMSAFIAAPAAASPPAQAADAASHATSSAASPSSSIAPTAGGAAQALPRRIVRWWGPAWIAWTRAGSPAPIENQEPDASVDATAATAAERAADAGRADDDGRSEAGPAESGGS